MEQITKRTVGYKNMTCDILDDSTTRVEYRGMDCKISRRPEKRNIVTFYSQSGRRLGQLIGKNLFVQVSEGLAWTYQKDMVDFCRNYMKIEEVRVV